MAEEDEGAIGADWAMGPEEMKPLLRHSIGQHDLKTVVRSNFRPEMAEK